MSSQLLRQQPATTPGMLAVFDDAATVRHALAFETALARAEAEEGLIDRTAAEVIAASCATIVVDTDRLAADAARAGTLAIPLVATLRAAVQDPAIAAAIHHGATSQDLADTVLMRQAHAALDCLRPDLQALHRGLRTQSECYATLPAVGRTLLQDALPVAFGLRLAQALAGIDAAWFELEAAVSQHARLQFGGAAGTRGGLAGRGAAVGARMATALELRAGPPWHAQRFGIGAIATALGLLCGAIGKLARDIALLAQNAIGEAREPLIAGRGGSSAMAHKRNPTGCQVALSAAIRSPGLVASILAGLPQEQERGLGGWQAEAPVLIELFLLAAGSASAMAAIALQLDVDEAAITGNLDDADLGHDIGESGAIIDAILATLRKG